MRIGEVALCTNDVPTLAAFYRWLLSIDAPNGDDIHQTLIAEETMLTVYNDGSVKNNENNNICLAFTVPDVDVEYARLVAAGVTIVSPPETRPWGARNLCFLDPDNNRVYLRSLPA